MSVPDITITNFDASPRPATSLYNHRYSLAGMVTVALIAGVAGGVALDSTRGKFDNPPPTAANPTTDQEAKYNRERQAALRWSAAASTGIAGALISALLGLGVGIGRQSILGSIVRPIVGGAAGALLVGMGGMVGQHYYAVVSSSNAPPGLLQSVLMQSTFWLPQSVAVAVCCATSLRLRQTIGPFVSLLLGALLASALVPVFSLVLFLITQSSSKDMIPPSTRSHCLLMSLSGTMVLTLLGWLSVRAETGPVSTVKISAAG